MCSSFEYIKISLFVCYTQITLVRLLKTLESPFREIKQSTPWKERHQWGQVDGLPALDAMLHETLNELKKAHTATVLDIVFTADPVWGAQAGSTAGI